MNRITLPQMEHLSTVSSNDIDLNVGRDATDAMLKICMFRGCSNLTTFPKHRLQYAMQ